MSIKKNETLAREARDEKVRSARFRKHARNHQLVKAQCPFGVQRLSMCTTRPEGPSLRMDGWDGMDGWGIKSVLQFSSYYVSQGFISLHFVGI